MITVTSLVHPTMIKKIRQGLSYAVAGQGHKMGGHGNRVYVANSKGHNIMRIDWKGCGKFIAYGGSDWGQTDVTEIVKEALQRGCSANRVKPRALDITEKPSPQAIEFVQNNPDLKVRLAKLATLAGMGTVLTACSNHGGVMSLSTIIGSLFA